MSTLNTLEPNLILGDLYLAKYFLRRKEIFLWRKIKLCKCVSSATVCHMRLWRHLSTMNILLAGARPRLTLEQVPENVTEISINLLVEGTNRKRRKKDVTVLCDKGTNRNI